MTSKQDSALVTEHHEGDGNRSKPITQDDMDDILDGKVAAKPVAEGRIPRKARTVEKEITTKKAAPKGTAKAAPKASIVKNKTKILQKNIKSTSHKEVDHEIMAWLGKDKEQSNKKKPISKNVPRNRNSPTSNEGSKEKSSESSNDELAEIQNKSPKGKNKSLPDKEQKESEENLDDENLNEQEDNLETEKPKEASIPRKNRLTEKELEELDKDDNTNNQEEEIQDKEEQEEEEQEQQEILDSNQEDDVNNNREETEQEQEQDQDDVPEKSIVSKKKPLKKSLKKVVTSKQIAAKKNAAKKVTSKKSTVKKPVIDVDEDDEEDEEIYEDEEDEELEEMKLAAKKTVAKKVVKKLTLKKKVVVKKPVIKIVDKDDDDDDDDKEQSEDEVTDDEEEVVIPKLVIKKNVKKQVESKKLTKKKVVIETVNEDNDEDDDEDEDEEYDDEDEEVEEEKPIQKKKKKKTKKQLDKEKKLWKIWRKERKQEEEKRKKKKRKIDDTSDDDDDEDIVEDDDSDNEMPDEDDEMDTEDDDSDEELDSDEKPDPMPSKKKKKKTVSTDIDFEEIDQVASGASLPDKILQVIRIHAKSNEAQQKITSTLVKNLQEKVDSKSSGMWKNFSKFKQQAFIWGGAISSKIEPLKLTESCRKFFENPAAYGLNELQDILDHVKAEGMYGHAHLLILVKKGCTWGRTGEPMGFTIAAVIPEGEHAQEQREKMEHAEDNLKWSEKHTVDDVQVFRNKTLYAATTFEEMVMQIKTYRVVTGVVFGKKSILYNQITKMINHMKSEKPTYQQLGNNTNRFYVRFLFRIDVIIQKFLSSCTNETEFEKVKFSFLKNKLEALRETVEDHSFMCTLPEKYTTKEQSAKMLTKEDIGIGQKSDIQHKSNNNQSKKQEQNNKNNSNNNNSNNNNNRNTNKSNNNNNNNNISNNNNNNKPTPIDNPNHNPNWKIPMDYNAVGYMKDNAKTYPVPKYQGNMFCVHFHAKGRCMRGANCDFEHQDPRDVGMAEKFESYVKRMQDKK